MAGANGEDFLQMAGETVVVDSKIPSSVLWHSEENTLTLTNSLHHFNKRDPWHLHLSHPSLLLAHVGREIFWQHFVENEKRAQLF